MDDQHKANAMKAALKTEALMLFSDGRRDASTAISNYLATATDHSLVRLHDIITGLKVGA